LRLQCNLYRYKEAQQADLAAAEAAAEAAHAEEEAARKAAEAAEKAAAAAAAGGDEMEWSGDEHEEAVLGVVDAIAHNMVGLHRLNTIDPELESAWFQPLNFPRDIVVSEISWFFIFCKTQLVPLQHGVRGGERYGAYGGWDRG
jgi:hypothetical protein